MILWLRFLDWLGSRWRTYKKIRRLKKRWPGANPTDMERSGRKFSRVSHVISLNHYAIRPEPGWEWDCQQCHTYSFVTENDMPDILEEYRQLEAKAIKRGHRMTYPAPTPATAGCPECKFRPGGPE